MNFYLFTQYFMLILNKSDSFYIKKLVDYDKCFDSDTVAIIFNEMYLHLLIYGSISNTKWLIPFKFKC